MPRLLLHVLLLLLLILPVPTQDVTCTTPAAAAGWLLRSQGAAGTAAGAPSQSQGGTGTGAGAPPRTFEELAPQLIPGGRPHAMRSTEAARLVAAGSFAPAALSAGGGAELVWARSECSNNPPVACDSWTGLLVF